MALTTEERVWLMWLDDKPFHQIARETGVTQDRADAIVKARLAKPTNGKPTSTRTVHDWWHGHGKKPKTRLQARRLKAGLTQTELATRTDISRAHISVLENGHHHGPYRKLTLKALAQALKCTPKEIASDLRNGKEQ